MTSISIQKNNVRFFKPLKSFTVSGKEVGFATQYDLKNDKTGKSKTFNFFESTGSEWDVNTLWIYKSDDGFILNVTNSDVTEQQRQNYFDAKTR